MGFDLQTSISALAVFAQGLLSFFSPCVLPLVPLYLGYLAGGAKTTDETGTVRYKQGKVLLHTLFFIIGIGFAFTLLGFGFTALGKFFTQNQTLFARISGIIIILFGLFQIGFFDSKFLQKEKRLPFQLDKIAMNPFTALLLGFTFSFAWTPCVGPALASVLLLASSAKTAAVGFGLVGVYTLGFVLPFLAVGFFTASVLDFFKKHQKIVKYTVKAGGVLLIAIGIMTFTGWMNGITSYLSQASTPKTSPPAASASSVVISQSGESEKPVSSQNNANTKVTPAVDFTLVDQYGQTHTLSDYKGKVVFLNFWATWCPPCRKEMPDIQALYEDWGENSGDVVILGVANPKSAQYPNNQDVSEEEIGAFLQENGYTYPTVMDPSGQVFAQYGISAFPTTFMIDRQGNVMGYVPGAITRDIMDSIIQQTMEQAPAPSTGASQ